MHLEGVTLNMPLIIEVVDEQLKLEPLLPELKRIVDDRGLATNQVEYVLQKSALHPQASLQL